jgi:hypothetical protein
MISRDYTKELGLAPAERRLPLPVTIAVLALVAAAGVMFVRQVYAVAPLTESDPAPLKVSSR